VLKKYLIADEADPNSSNDFGKNIINALLDDKKKVFAYEFSDYWKDVGTIQSLWEANMDLLDPDVPIEIKDSKFKIYARNYAEPPALISKTAEIKNSFVAEGSRVKGNVINSIISTGCTIAEDAVIMNSVIMPDTKVEQGAVVKYSIIGEQCTIGTGAKIGKIPSNPSATKKNICVVGKGTVVDADETIL